MSAEISAGNLLTGLALAPDTERIDQLLSRDGVRIERIVSTGQASPPDFWYDQDGDEFVLLLAGSAGVQFAGEDAPRELHVGDWLVIPAHLRHRVAWTSPTEPTVWLAVHLPPA